MKFYISQLPTIINKISNNEIYSLLLYGPDKGHISRIYEKIKTHFNMWQTNISYSDFVANQDIILNSKNFFGKKEIIKITDVVNNNIDKIKSIFLTPIEHFPIFIADELKSIGIRKFFEEHKNLAIIGCYNDNNQDINKYIIKKLNENAKTIESEALVFLCTHLKGDHFSIENELNKILYFTHNTHNITLTDVEKVLSKELVASGDMLCIYFAQNNYKLFTDELNILLDTGINIILILRTLIKYYINLYIFNSYLNTGISLDQAIKTLSPPIFFKYIEDFKANAAKIKPHTALSIIELLQEAEINFKNYPHNFDFYQQVISKIYL